MSEPLILAWDTSGAGLVMALSGPNGHLIAGLTVSVPRQHARLLPVAAQDLLARAGVSREHVTALAVVTGPGSYAGLRVGIAAAKGLSFALHVPTVPLSAFEVAAHGTGEWPGPVLAVVDARRGAFERQWFGPSDGRGRRSPIGPASRLSAEQVVDERIHPPVDGAVRVCGSGVSALLAQSAELTAARPGSEPAGLAAVAWCGFEEGRAIEPMALSPVYLRPALKA